MKRINSVAVVPTLCTLANLVCGFFAIVVAARVIAPDYHTVESPTVVVTADRYLPKAVLHLDPGDPTHNVMLSGLLILFALLFDALDGYIARLSHATSDFGAYLDSLADLVTFGVAPAFLLVKMCPRFAFDHQKGVWAIACLLVICAALRLARFNAEMAEDDDHFVFRGLPVPAAAAAIAGFALMFFSLRHEDTRLIFAGQIDAVLQAGLPFFAVMLSLLMVSRIPYPHVANHMARGMRSFGHVVRLVFAVVALMAAPSYSLAIVCCTFVLWGPLRYLWEEVIQRQPHEEPLF